MSTSISILTTSRNLTKLSKVFNSFESFDNLKSILEDNYEVRVHLPSDYPYLHKGDTLELNFLTEEGCLDFIDILKEEYISFNKL